MVGGADKDRRTVSPFPNPPWPIVIAHDAHGSPGNPGTPECRQNVAAGMSPERPNAGGG